MTTAKNISIKSFLAERGVTPKSERAGYGMYLSPLRQESTPSFKVDYNKNLWYDFGIGVGGFIIDLVMKLENCNVSEAFAKLERRDYSFNCVESAKPVEPSESPIKITSVKELEHPNLLGYLCKRAINLDIAKKFCKEVHYTLHGKPYYAVGFQSDEGAWELRNEYFKGGSSPKSATTIDNGKEVCILFEGFMDLLAYLTLKNAPEPPINIAVLNSVGNFKRVSNFLTNHKVIHCFLDNDEAGRRALTEVQKLGVEVVDHSNFYRGHKDMNEYLIAKNSVQEHKPRIKMKF